jgi:prefoldin subunit 5
MNKLNIEDMELDSDDERGNYIHKILLRLITHIIDSLIGKLKEVNEKLKFKLKELEKIVQDTVDKAYTAAKGSINTHRLWDTEDDTLKEKEQEIREYQGQIEICKKKIKGLKSRLNALTHMEKMVNVNNQLKDSERTRKKLEDEVKVLEK